MAMLTGFLDTRKVYINKSNTIAQFKRNIQEEIKKINGNTLTKVTENVLTKNWCSIPNSFWVIKVL